jgi:hypothetical protein
LTFQPGILLKNPDTKRMPGLLGLLMWGETLDARIWEMEDLVNEMGEDRGHCSFTPLDTIVPSLDKLYA